MGTPYFTILKRDTRQDISDFVERFAFEESTEKDNVLAFAIIERKRDEFIGASLLKVGDEIEFIYGYRRGVSSPTRLARVTSIQRRYSGHMTVEIKATDLGLLAKRGRRFDNWGGRTSAQIAAQIARRNGFDATITQTASQYEQMPQAGRTDWEMLKYLASLEDDFRVYFQGSRLFFQPRDLKQASAKLYDYKAGRADIISFATKEQDNTKKIESKETEYRAVNPETGEVITGTAKGDDSTEGKLGEFTVHFNDRGSRLYATPSQAQRAQNSEKKQVKYGGVPNKGELDRMASHDRKKASLEDFTARLDIAGDPDRQSDSIVTLAGFAEQDCGNWYVCTVSHTITQGGYFTGMELKKNSADGTGERLGNTRNEPASKNTTKGQAEPAKTKPPEIIIYDANGKEVQQ